MIRLSCSVVMLLCILSVAGCKQGSEAPPAEQVGQMPSPDVATPDANVLSLIEEYYFDEEARKGLTALPKGKVFEQLLIALQSDNRNMVHSASTLLRDQYGSPSACGPIRQLLAQLLADPKRETLFTRMVCCQILGKYPEKESIPILIQALDDPGDHHSMAAAPDGTAEHAYRAVWVDALRALEAIGGEGVSSYAGHVSSASPREKWVAEAKAWWQKRKESSNNRIEPTH